jgi:PAS domain S-box-containing protein
MASVDLIVLGNPLAMNPSRHLNVAALVDPDRSGGLVVHVAAGCAEAVVSTFYSVPELQVALTATAFELVILGQDTGVDSLIEAATIVKALRPAAMVTVLGDIAGEAGYARLLECDVDECVPASEPWRLAGVARRLAAGRPAIAAGVNFDCLAQLIDQGDAAAFICDLSERLTYWNRGAEKIFGWSAAEVVGKSLEAVFGVNPAPPFFKALSATLRGECWSGEVALPDRRGAMVEVRLRVSRSIASVPASSQFFLFSAVDVSQLREAERRSIDVQKLLGAVTAQAEIPTVVIDLETNAFVDANEIAAAKLGYTRAELLQKQVGDVAALNLDQLTAAQGHFLRLGGGELTTTHRTKSGKLLPVRIVCRHIVTGGRRLGFVTERYLDAGEAGESQPAGPVISRLVPDPIADVDAPLRAMVAVADGPMVVTDPETLRFVAFSDAAARCLGYTHEEFTRLTLPDIKVSEPGFSMPDHIHAVVQGDEAEFEAIHRTKFGLHQTVRVVTKPVTVGGRVLVLAVWRIAPVSVPSVDSGPASRAADELGFFYSPATFSTRDASAGFIAAFTPDNPKADALGAVFSAANEADRWRLSQARARRLSGLYEDVEFRARTVDGRERWFVEKARTVDGSKFGDVFVRLVDITARREAESRFSLVSIRLDHMVHVANDGFWEWPDITRTAQWWSPRYYELLGFVNQEFPATTEAYGALVHPDDHDLALAMAARMVKNGAPVEVRTRLRTKAGVYRWVCCRAALFEQPGGVIAMVGTIRDIHEKAVAAVALLASAASARKDARAILASAPPRAVVFAGGATAAALGEVLATFGVAMEGIESPRAAVGMAADPKFHAVFIEFNASSVLSILDAFHVTRAGIGAGKVVVGLVTPDENFARLVWHDAGLGEAVTLPVSVGKLFPVVRPWVSGSP